MPQPASAPRVRPRADTFFDIVERLPEPVGLYRAVRDDGGRIVDFLIEYVNPATARSNGIPRERQVGRRLLEVSPGQAGAELFRAYCDVVESGRPLAKEGLVYQDVAEDGRRFLGAYDIYAVKLDDGLVSSWHDSSERREAEVGLRASEERLRLLVESIRDLAIFMLDPKGRVLTWSAGAQLVQGYTADEVIGQPDTIFLPPNEDDTWTRVALDRARREGRHEFEGWRVKKDGSRFWAHVVIHPVLDEAEALRGFTMVIRDLSERRRAEAQAAEARSLRALQRVVERLMRVYTPEEVAGVIVDQASEAQPGVVAAAVQLVTDDGALRLVTRRGVPDELARRYAQMPLADENPIADAVRTRVPLWFSSGALLDEGYPGCRSLLTWTSDAFAVIPLVSEGEALGVLSLSYRDPQPFDAEQRDFLLTLARQCALALERARLLERERVARRRADRLRSVAEAFAGLETQAEVADVAVRLLSDAVHASLCTFFVLEPDGRHVRMLSCNGAARRFERVLERKTLEDASPPTDCIRTRAPVIVSSAEAYRARYPHLAPFTLAEAPGTRVGMPLLLDGAPVGAFGIGFPDWRVLDPSDLELLRALARQCALALHRARLAEQERRQAERFALLAETSRAFQEAGTDVATVLHVVTRLVGQALRAGCAVQLASDDGAWLDFVALHDPTRPRGASILEERRRQPVHEGLPGRVIASGESLLLPRVDARVLRGGAGPTPWASLDETGFHSLLLVPLRLHGRALGCMTLVRPDGEPPFDEGDAALAEELADRGSLAIENARLLEAEQRALSELHASADRLRLLADASHTFAESSLDLPSALGAIAGAVGAFLGDACSIYLLDDSGERLELVGFFHDDLDAVAAVEPLLRKAGVRLGEGLVGRVAATGTSAFLPRVATAELAAQAPTLPAELLERWRLHSVVVAPLRASGRVIGVLGIARGGDSPPYVEQDARLVGELADRAGLAIENARLYDELSAAVRLRDEFLSIAGHELRTPLAALQLYLHSLLRTLEHGEPTGIQERLERMRKNADRLGRLISELLDVSRIVGGRLQLELDEVDLGAVARDVAELCAVDLEQAGCELALDLPNEPVVGRFDRGRLEQVVLNLLLNAAKYGRGQPVGLGVRAREGLAELSVTDHGIGIAAEDQARIFERFERAVSSAHFGGLGVGLWVARQIVEAHGGNIHVESRPGEGATFTVALPLAPGPRA